MVNFEQASSVSRGGLLDLLDRVVSSEDRPLVQKILLGMWAQWEGRGLRGVTENLLSSIALEKDRLSVLYEISSSQKSHWEALEEWSRGLKILLNAISEFEMTASELDTCWYSKFSQGKHPLSRHGFTSNGLYSALWNRYEISVVGTQECENFKRLQWWWTRVQCMVLSEQSISWEDYLSRLEASQSIAILREKLRPKEGRIGSPGGTHDAIEHQQQEAVVASDAICDLTDISFQAVGRGLRRLSEFKHADFLIVAVSCCADDLHAGLTEFQHLESRVALWKSPDAGLQRDRVDFANAFRLVAEKILDRSYVRDPSTRSDGGRGGGTRATKSGGHIGGHQNIPHDKPPEDLPEFITWIPSQEIVGKAEEDEAPEDTGVEAPRRTGLQLINPADIRSHMAKAKAQSHHVAMIRQGFPWDRNTLSPSERQALVSFVTEVTSEVNSEVNSVVAEPIPDVWWPKALVAVAWVCGRSLEEAGQLVCLDGEDWDLVKSDVLGVGEINGRYHWRWPLRLPNPVIADNFTDGVPRVDHVVVPDCSGLAAALVRAHQLRQVKQSKVFGWRKKPEKRLQEVKDVMGTLHGDVVDRGVTEALMARDLRITLLNLAPDKTIAWMLAGTLAESKEPRMFYASHAPDELVAWVLNAHKRMGLCGPEALPAVPMLDWPKSFAGAKFLPKMAMVQELARKAREQAGVFPSLDAVVKLKGKAAATKPPIPFPIKASPPETTSQAGEASQCPWSDPVRWRQWHDDVVFWVWVVQALQTSQRATRYPVLIYQQWLEGSDRNWVSLEDKRTADRDESRSGVISPLLGNAFELLTQVQALFRLRWGKQVKKTRTSAKKPLATRDRPVCPYAFVVFDGGAQPKDLTPAWIQRQINTRLGLHWPVNFNRALLRRALAQQGLDGDGLDAFLGHGSLADRVHDRHSLFNMGHHHQNLYSALKRCAQEFGLERLDIPRAMRPKNTELARQRRQAAREISRKTQPPVPKRSADPMSVVDKAEVDPAVFEGWKAWVTLQLKRADTKRGLYHLKQWHATLLSVDLPFARYVLGLEGPLSPFVGPMRTEDVEALKGEHQKQAKVLEAQVVEWVANGEMRRSVAAHGLNLSYLLCLAQDATMPTMWVAMTAHARVSPFTFERVAMAVRARQWSERCVHSLKEPSFGAVLAEFQTPQEQAATRQVLQAEEAKVKLALCTMLNMTASKERWRACVQSLLTPSVCKGHLFDTSYDYQIKGLQGRTRDVRGFVDVVTAHAKPLPVMPDVGPTGVRDVYGCFRPQSAKIAVGLSNWVHGIQWFGHMHLPPLIAAHLEGSLNDQSVQGPLARELGWWDEGALPKARPAQGFGPNDDLPVAGLRPFTVLDGAPNEPPFGWVPGIDPAGSRAAAWLSGYLWDSVGASSGSATLEDLSDALMESWDEVPSRLRRGVAVLIQRIRAYNKLDRDDEVSSTVDGVDRQVIDFDTYKRILAELEVRIVGKRIEGRARQTRLRLLIVLAFRLGMRRREILCLRRGDIDLSGDGRIHIRPYKDIRPYADASSRSVPYREITHTLKTGFSQRSLPICLLLNDQERQWLTEACEQSEDARKPSDPMRARLFPSHEHDTLSRDAIALLREVAGDGQLKLHHLRHSFASWMALKVLFARQVGWAEVFAGHPSIHEEMQASPALLGSILKPQLSAGDFLIIPRMLGHSSYEVSLTNYVHTLDLVAALFLNHQLSEEILPARDRGRLIGRRFDAASALHKAAVSGQVPLPANLTQGGTVPAPVKPWSKPVAQALLEFAASGGFGPAVELPPDWSLPTAQEVQNWHEPRHALDLRAQLMAGVDRLDRADVARLVELARKYWVDNPPMFWLGPRQIKKMPSACPEGGVVDPAPDARLSVQQELTTLLQIVRKMELPRGCASFWRYKATPADEHRQMWGSLIEVHGFEAQILERYSGSAKAVNTLGVSLGMQNARRSPLPGVLWRTLGLVLSRMP